MLKRSKTDQSSGRRRGGPAKVLVVDDNPDAATLVGRILRRAEFEVAEAGEYNLAIATIANEPGLSVVLAAFSIAGSGASLKLLDAIRNNKNPDLRDLRVVMITDHPRQLLFAWQAGVDDVLVRPVHADDLCQVVAEVVGRDDVARDAYRQQQAAMLSAPNGRAGGDRPVFS